MKRISIFILIFFMIINAFAGILAEYYNGQNFDELVMKDTIYQPINFYWEYGAPANNMNSDNFSVKWSGVIYAPRSGNYRFKTNTDDGCRLFIDDSTIINDWSCWAGSRTSNIYLNKGYHLFEMQMKECGGTATANLFWTVPDGNEEIVPADNFFINQYNDVSEHYNCVDSTGIPYHIIIDEINIDDGLGLGKTEIGIFDDSLCVGSISLDNPNVTNLDITCWEGQPDQGLPGFTAGDSIQFKILTEVYGEYYEETEPEVTFSQGNGTFGYGAYTSASVSFETGIYPSIEVTPGTLIFPEIREDSSARNKITVNNTGNAELNIGSIECDNGNFSLESYNSMIQPGDSEIVEVTFRPTSAGLKEGTIKVSSNDPDQNEVLIPVSGQCIPPKTPVISADPTTVDFENVLTGITKTKPIQIFNTGSKTLQVYDISLPNSSFSVDSSSFEILPGQSQTVQVKFQPQFEDEFSGNLNIQSNATNAAPLSIWVQGSGFTRHFQPVQPTGVSYNVVIDSAIVDNHSLQAGDEIAVFDNELCVGNSVYDGNLPLKISAWKASEKEGMVGYTDGNSIEIKLWATTYNNTVELTPNVSWIDGQGKFGESTYSTAQISAQSGLEPIIKTSADRIDFETVSINSEKTEKLFIYNEGASQLEVNSITSSSNAFSANQNNFTIPVGASSTIDLTFEPDQETIYNETITIQTNDPQQRVKVINVSGTGFPVTNTNIDVSLTPIQFSNTQINDTSQAELVLTNSGSGVINIYSVSTTNNSFFVKNDYFSIQPGQTYKLPVFFNPTDSKLYSGSINISNNSQNMENINIELQGTGYEKYFHSVEPTGLPYQIIVDRLDVPPQISLQVGDELGIFDGSQCVGTVVIDHDSTNINKKALSLDNDYIEIDNSENLDPLYGDFTLEAWIKTADSSGKNVSIISKRQGQYSKTLQLRIDNGKAVFASTGNDHNVRVVSGGFVNDGEWHHIAGVRRSFNLYLYVDGQLENSVNDVYNINSSDNWKIGFDEMSGNYFQGQLDEIRIWKKARTQEDIQKDMYQILTGNEEQLKGHWKCDQIVNNLIPDNSAENMGGNISGNPILTSPAPPGDQMLEAFTGTAWEKDEAVPGFESGQPIQFRYFANRDGITRIYDASFDYQEGDGNFATDPYARGSVNVSSTSIQPYLSQQLPRPVIAEDDPATFIINDLNNYFSHQYDTLQFNLENPDTSWGGASLVENSRISVKPEPNWFGTAELYVSASDDYFTLKDTFSVDVQSVNDPPVITSKLNDQAQEDVYYSYQASANDPDPQDIEYIFKNRPQWMSADEDSVFGTPREGMLDTSFQVIASDGSLHDTAFVNLQVLPVNDHPEITSEDSIEVVEDLPFEYLPKAVDPEDSTLSFEIEELPSWMSVNKDTISGTPRENTPDTSFKIICSDGELQDSLRVYVDFIAVNDTPFVASKIQDIYVEEDTPDSSGHAVLGNCFSDIEEGGNLQYTIDYNSDTTLAQADIDSESGSFDLNFQENAYGQAEIVVKATDSGELWAKDSFSVFVRAVNDTPFVADPIPDVKVNEDCPDSNSHVDLNNVFHDVEEKDSLNFTIMNNTNPSLVEASIGSEDSTLDLSFAPDSNGTAWLKIRASDSTGLFTEDSFSVQVASVNDTPFVVGSIPDITVEEDAPDSSGHYDLENAFDDIEQGSQLTYTIANSSTPELVNVDIVKNKLNIQFLQNATGQTEITIKARDSGKLFTQTSFNIDVTPVNDAPKITTQDSIQVTEDQYFVYPPSVFDPDGPDTIFTFDHLPEWLSSSADSVYGTPEEGTADTSFRIIASDGLLADTMVVELAVDSVNDAPQIISDSSLTATEDSLFNYTVVAEDPDDIVLDYQYIGLPSWLTAEKDKVSGTPREGSQDTSFMLVVSDPLSSDSLKVNIDYISINDNPYKTDQIHDVIVDEDALDSLNHVILDEIFHDEEDEGQLSYQVYSNSNPKLVDIEIGEQSALNFSFYPQANGKSEIIVEGSDSGGLHVRDSFLVVVNSINDRPEIVKNIPDVIVNEDASDTLGHVDLNNIFNDVEQEGNLQFTIVENTKESVFAAEINSVDSTLDLSFQPDSHGVGQVKIRATDSSGLSIYEEFRVVVNSVNDSPFAINEIQDIDVKEDSPDLNNYVDLNNIFSDVEDGSNLNFDIVKNSRPGLLDVMVEPSDSSLKISFAKDSSGLTNITIRATDSDNGFVEDSFKINIEAINDRPFLTSLDAIQITEDEYFSYQPQVADPDGPDTIFTYLNVPGWLESTPDSVYGIPLEGTPDTSFGIVASDGLAFDTMLVELEVDSVNDAPDIVSDGDLIANEDSLFSYQLIAHDPDNIELNYKYRDLPSWLSADENLISGTPLQGSTDTSFVAIVSDNYSSDSLLINIDYIPVNDKPYLTNPIPDLNTEEDAADILDFVNLENIFQDEEDGDSLTYEILSNSNTSLVDLVLDTAKKNLDCLFLSNAYGQAEIIISARDRENSQASDTFQVNVSSVNDKPVVAQSIPDIRVDEDAPDSLGHVDLNNVFYDIEEKSNLDFSINNSNPSILGVNINSKDSTLDLAFEPDSNGISNITVRATDSSGLFVEEQFKITINSVNDEPSVIIGIPDLQVDEDSPDSLAYADLNDVFYDIENGHNLIFSVAENSNPGLLSVNINPGDSTLDLSFIPDSAGIANIAIRATDFHGASIEEKFQITVNSINDAPQITSKRYTEATEHEKYVYYVQAHDPDDINLDITIDQLPEWLETDSDSVFGNTPEGAQDNDFRIVASDALLSDTLLVEVAVDSVNDPPQITSPDSISALEEEQFIYLPEVTDPDNNTHTFIYKDLPSWISTRNDSLFGIPPEGVDSTTFQLIASDGQLQDGINVFVNIKPINDPPVITSADSIRVAEDQNFVYQTTVDDPDNSNFQYTFTDLPSWMSSEGGEVSGTPGEGVEDTSFVVVASDGEYSDLKQVYVEVVAVQDAPDIITENLKTGYEQAQYQDSIEAVDSDIDDQLSYYLLESPKWLSINSLSGKLSGVPDHKNVGINIPVSVMVEDLAGLSDTLTTAINVYDTLAPGVPQNLSGTPGSQTIYLSWSPVQDNDFDKYRIYYDTDPHPTQSKLATIGGQRNDTSITITELDKDKEYYIRITAIDSAGNVSGFSNEIALKPGLITSIYPRPNMTAVSADTSLKVTFGKALDQNTTADSNFYVYGSQYGYMEGELIIGQQYIEFMPNDEFYPGERVSVIITERIKFEDGSRLANGYSWRYDIVSQGGSGFFALEERYNTDYDVREISAGDFDENRDIEIVAGSDRAHINYFNLNRNENEGVRYNASTNSYDVTSADFDLDGDRDIASLYYHEGGKINVWYNDGNGKFPDRTDYFNVLDDTDGGLSNLKSGDIDNDGDQDLIGVANFGDSDMDQVVIIFNDGQGNFNSSKKVDVEPYSEFQYYRNNFDLVDYDLNGTQDILVKAGNNKVKVLFNSGNAEFERSKTVLNSYNINTLECTDIDGDGDCDLLIGDSERLGIFKKQDTLLVGTFEYDVNDYIHNIISKDFNNDGHRDIIVGGQDSPHSMVVLLNDGQNNFNSPINIQNQGQINYLYSFDRDNDGDLDLVTSHYDHEHIEVWRNRNRNQDIMTARESLNFGSLPLQTKDTMKLNIWNDGLYEILEISDISIPLAEFTVDKSTASLSPDDTLDLEVIFQPTEPGVYEDELEIYSDDPDQPIKEVNLQASASNYISGGVITENTTWSADQSPYYIQNNVAVDLGVSLTIEPGAIIQFAPEAGLIVDGELQARGSVSDSIIFIGDQSQRFNNLKFRSGSNINLEYFRVDGAGIEISSTDTDLRYGIVKNGNDYGVYIVDCEVSLSQIEVAGFNNYGVYARRDDDQFGLYVDNCKVHDNGNRGIYTQYIDYNHSIKILNSEIYNNSNYGIYCYRIYDGEISGNEIYDNGSGAGLFINDIYNSSATISSNQIYRNNYGIEINQSTTEAPISRNVIRDNRNDGLSVRWSKNLIEYNDIFNNQGDGIEIRDNDNSNTSYLPKINANNIYSNQGYELNIQHERSETVNARQNYWGITDSLAIAAEILNYYDNATSARCDFSDWYNNKVPLLPVDGFAAQTLSEGRIKLNWIFHSRASQYFLYTDNGSGNLDTNNVWKILDSTYTNYTSTFQDGQYEFAIQAKGRDGAVSPLSTISALADGSNPEMLSATGVTGDSAITVTFNEDLDKPSILDLNNWQLSNNLEIREIDIGGLIAEYYNGQNFDEFVMKDTIYQPINFYWEYGAPANNMDADNFSVKWSGVIYIPRSGNYRFKTNTDDGCRLIIDNQTIIDRWGCGTYHSSYEINLTKGSHNFQMQMKECGGTADASLFWTIPDGNEEIIPAENFNVWGNNRYVKLVLKRGQNLPLPENQITLTSNNISDIYGNTSDEQTVTFYPDDGNSNPSITMESFQKEVSDSIEVIYHIQDQENDSVKIYPRYSTDDGDTWKAAAVIGDTTGIIPENYGGNLIWNSSADLPNVELDSVKFKLIPQDSDPHNTGTPALSERFRLDNSHQHNIQITLLDTLEQYSDSIDVIYQVEDPSHDDNLSLNGYYKTPDSIYSATFIGNMNNLDTNSYSDTLTWPSRTDLAGQDIAPLNLQISVSDGWQTSQPDSTMNFHLDNNQLPFCQLENLIGEQSDSISVNYQLGDPEDDSLGIEAFYSTDSINWYPAHLCGDTLGITDYTGEIIWDSRSDIQGKDLEKVWLAMIPFDNDSGKADTTSCFHLDNNRKPEIEIAELTGEQKDDVEIPYSLFDAEDDSISIHCEYYDKQNQEWINASITGDTLSPGKDSYSNTIIWNSREDLPQAAQYIDFRITPKDIDPGQPDTVSIMLDNLGVPSISITTSMEGEFSADIPFSYQINDDEKDTISLTPEYSLDGGENWFVASISGDTTGIDSTEYDSLLIWNSHLDADSIDIGNAKFRITPKDEHKGITTVTSAFHLDNNYPPETRIETKDSINTGQISLTYLLSDRENDTLALNAKYSISNIDSFQTATLETPDFGLDSSVYSDTLIWNSLEDIGEVTDSIEFYVTALDNDTGLTDTVSIFVDNDIPSISLDNIEGEQSDTVIIAYEINNDSLSTVSMLAEYSIDNGNSWQMASIDGDTSNLGYEHFQDSLNWLSCSDLDSLDLNEVKFRITPCDINQGAPQETNIFHLDNNYPPLVNISKPDSINTGMVNINYDLSDRENDLLGLNAKYYDVEKDSFVTGTIENQLTAIDSSEYKDSLAWDSQTDLGNISDSIDFCLNVSDNDQGQSDTVSVFVDNIVPKVTLEEIVGEQSDTVTLSYKIENDNSSLVDLFCEFSSNGSNWEKASLVNELTGLDSDQYTGKILWASRSDLPGIDQKNVRMRITPSDINTGDSTATNPFHLDNNYPPQIETIFMSQEEISSDYEFDFFISDQEDDTSKCLFKHSIDGGDNWMTSSMADTIKAQPSSIDTFMNTWKTEADFPNTDVKNVLLQITPLDNDTGQSFTSDSIHVDNETGPVVLETYPQDFGLWQDSIIVVFDRKIRKPTASSWSISGNKSDQDLVSMNQNEDGDELYLIPDPSLPAGDTISIKLNSGIVDSLGKSLDGDADGDPEGSPLDDYEWQFTTPTLADYNNDQTIDGSDLTLFANAWKSEPQDLAFEIGPAQGQPPFEEFAPDSIIDFEDFVSLTRMWDWALDPGSLNKLFVNQESYKTLNKKSASKTDSKQNRKNIESNDQVSTKKYLNLQKDNDYSLVLEPQISDDPWENATGGKFNIAVKINQDNVQAINLIFKYDDEILDYKGLDNSGRTNNSLAKLSDNKFTSGTLNMSNDNIFFTYDQDNISVIDMVKVGTSELTSDQLILEYKVARPDVTQIDYYYSLFDNYGRTLGKSKSQVKIDTKLLVPEKFKIYQNYPNPFNSRTILKYQLPVSCHVRVDIYNLLGQKVKTLVNTEKEAGYYLARWNSKNKRGELVSSGMYIYRIIANSDEKRFLKTRKMLLLK